MRTHGYAPRKNKLPGYSVWAGMIQRCTNPKRERYPRYGGRGIKVCERWLKFENFLADMGQKPEGKSIDRIDSNGNYEPGNCRWATPKEQAANTKGPRGGKGIVRVNKTGQVFGEWTIGAFVRIGRKRNSLWECICSCGTVEVMEITYVRRRAKKGCGCKGLAR